MRETVLLFTSLKEPVDALTDEQAGQLFKAILSYQMGEAVSLDGLLNVVFLQIKQQLDYNNDKYNEMCKKRSDAGKKGMQARWKKADNNDSDVITNDNNAISVITSDNKNNYNDNDNVNDTDTDNDNENDNDNVIKKEKKHIYGEYKHVRLTDKERDQLFNDYGEAETHDAIKYLDEYIEMKGYKAKSHYLCMRKWVFDAVKEQGYKKQYSAQGQPQSLYDKWMNA